MDNVTKDPQIISGIVEEVVGSGETFTLLKLFPETYLTLEHHEDDFSECPLPIGSVVVVVAKDFYKDSIDTWHGTLTGVIKEIHEDE